MADRAAISKIGRLLGRLLRDRAGNTLVMIAAALIPMLAMLGGGIDMGRSYLSQSRIQQACDAGVLAARKKLGSQVVTTGIIPDAVATVGTRFFNLNYQTGAYGSKNRQFQMTLENDYAISGVASVDVPTTIMTLFGYDNMAINVKCEAKLNFSNTDVMFVLDTTGSMADTNPGDSSPKIAILKNVVSNFHAQLEGSKSPGTVIRYGFVPYSSNVNVGALLADDWVVTDWKYQSREQVPGPVVDGTTSYARNWRYVSGSVAPGTQESAYAATWHPPVPYSNPGSTTIDAYENVVVIPPSSGTTPGYYSCDGATPVDNVATNYIPGATTNEPFAGPPQGTRTIQQYTVVQTGNGYSTALNGSQCQVMRTTYNDYTQGFEWITDPTRTTTYQWHYAQLGKDVSKWRSESNGCIEERSTYEIDDYGNVDLARALDLDIDLVPTTDVNTKWRPMYPDVVFARALKWDGTGSFTVNPQTTQDEYVLPAAMGLAACPAPARKLAPITSQGLSDYLSTLQPRGATYHDIGMIWGGRLLSPTGLFAAENADTDGKTISRNMIFLTDGLTEPFDLSYSSYGLEPLDRRRWDPNNPQRGLTLTNVIENRFSVACSEVKKRNITVWVIGFGTSLNPIMTQCAGTGHFFEAKNAAELSDVFNKIAAQLGDLRISK